MKLLLIILLSSCSSLFNTNEKDELKSLNRKKQFVNTYIDHLSALGKDYLLLKKNKNIQLSYQSKNYINKIVQDILKKNEYFFNIKEKVSFYIIDDNEPFHFSLPGKQIFFSSGLFTKYIKNESLLYCVLVFELIRSEKNIYPKTIIIPTGAKDTREILALLRLKINEKVEVHKWAINLLKKVNIDSDTYLSWLQIQNRNSIDFSNQLGDINAISREEALFKDFIIKNSRNQKREYRRSPRSFYSLLRELRGGA